MERFRILLSAVALVVLFVSPSFAVLTYDDPMVTMPPMSDGAGMLAVTDIGDMPPTPDVVPKNNPKGMRYTNRSLKYTTAPGDVGNKVTISLEVQRPYQNDDKKVRRRASGRLRGSLMLPQVSEFLNVMIGGEAFYTDSNGRVDNSGREGASDSFRLFANDVSNTMGSIGFNIPINKRPDGDSHLTNGMIQPNESGALVGRLMIMFTPTNANDMLVINFPDSAEYTEGVPEPVSAVLVTLSVCAVVRRRGHG